MKHHNPIAAAEEWVTPKKTEGNFLKDARSLQGRRNIWKLVIPIFLKIFNPILIREGAYYAHQMSLSPEHFDIPAALKSMGCRRQS